MNAASTTPQNGNHSVADWDGIVCFANDWSADPLSKKHLMLRFARSRRILWINSVNNRRPQLATKDMRRIWEKLSGFREGLKQVRAGAGSGAVCSVVEVAPWSRIPEQRALLVPRDD